MLVASCGGLVSVLSRSVWRVVVAGIVSVGLVAGTVTPVQAAAAADTPELSWEDVPLIESTPAQPVAPGIPAGEFGVPGEVPPSAYEFAPAKSD